MTDRTNAQVALAAAALINQRVEGTMTASSSTVLPAAEVFLRWLNEN